MKSFTDHIFTRFKIVYYVIFSTLSFGFVYLEGEKKKTE